MPGLVDHHAHLLRDAAGVAFPPGTAAVREFHHKVAAAGTTPMDVLDPPLAAAGPGRPPARRAQPGRGGGPGGDHRDGHAQLAVPGRARGRRRKQARCRSGFASTWPADSPARPVSTSWTRAAPTAARGCAWPGSSSTPTGGWARAPARWARTSPTWAAPGFCSPTPGGWPAGSRRWPGAAGGSPRTRSAIAPRRSCWTPMTLPGTAIRRQSRLPRPGSSTPACCRPT